MVCIHCVLPSLGGMFFTWYSSCTLRWEWALLLPMCRSSDYNSGFRCDFNYIGIIVCWYNQYAGSKGVVDCAGLKGFPSEWYKGLGDPHESIVSVHSVHELYGGIMCTF